MRRLKNVVIFFQTILSFVLSRVIINSVLKTNPWTHKLKDLNREKIIGSFHEKELLLSVL